MGDDKGEYRMNTPVAEEQLVRNLDELNDQPFPDGFLEHQVNRIMDEIAKLFHEMEGKAHV
jgi:FKBP-type peptidyl-prolyl cis-trans isomerase (trigger factor)